MHMSDALLSPAVGAAFWAGTLGAIAYCSKRLRKSLNEKIVPLMGVLGAFIFSAQMINFTIPGTGSSGHLGGGMILAVLLGPHAAFLVMASVLTVQALFFADGGLLSLGCNIWNLGIYPCFVAYPLVFEPMVRQKNSPGRILIASVMSGVIALQLGAFSVVLETLLSGKSELPLVTFLLLMQPIHLGIGIVEGIATAGVINYVRAARPEILESTPTSRHLENGISLKKVFMTFAMLALIAGGMLSWFASPNPDGLEWSVERVFGSPELPEPKTGVAPALKSIQEKTSFLPDYNFREPVGEPVSNETGKSESSWPAIKPGTSLSGIIGSLMVLTLVAATGVIIRTWRRKKTHKK
ncbi:MAG: energy-coupling factor ABC transporter permease [Nitrospirae bacterium]|nr:energy-coupling factor ABC transporter permease [Nitrospirota bacterium]